MEVSTDYHLDIGIPSATRIKEVEDRIFAGESFNGSRIVGGGIAPVGAHPYLVSCSIFFKLSKYLAIYVYQILRKLFITDISYDCINDNILFNFSAWVPKLTDV